MCHCHESGVQYQWGYHLIGLQRAEEKAENQENHENEYHVVDGWS